MNGLTADPLLSEVQLRCNENGCFDRNGRFTNSACDRRGCYPTSGVIGRVGRDGDPRYFSRRDAYENAPRFGQRQRSVPVRRRFREEHDAY